MGRTLFANRLLIILLLLENFFLYLSFKIGMLPPGKNAVCLFLSSLLIGIVLIYKFYNAKISEKQSDILKNKSFYIFLFFFLAALSILFTGYYSELRQHPVSIDDSDIIPLIQVICRRFLAGEYPYRIVYDFGYPLQATYLPLQWMPFTMAEKLHIDYRLIAFVIWCIAALWLFIRSMKINSIPQRIFILLLLLGANFILLSNKENGIILATVEIMIAAYYMLLISGLNQGNAIIQGIFISCCLLSRYSIVLWLPLYAFVLFISNNRKQLIGTVSVVLIIVCVFYVIPFLSKDWSSFYNSYKYYDKAALHEWTTDANHPLQLFQGTGFAYYIFTRFTNLDIPTRIKLLQRIHLLACISVVVIMGVWYWYNKRKINYKIFLLGSFKIYVAFFLFLIQVPYEYLMITGNFVSIAIFCEQARYQFLKTSPPSEQSNS